MARSSRDKDPLLRIVGKGAIEEKAERLRTWLEKRALPNDALIEFGAHFCALYFEWVEIAETRAATIEQYEKTLSAFRDAAGLEQKASKFFQETFKQLEAISRGAAPRNRLMPAALAADALRSRFESEIRENLRRAKSATNKANASNKRNPVTVADCIALMAKNPGRGKRWVYERYAPQKTDEQGNKAKSYSWDTFKARLKEGGYKKT